MAWLFCSFPFQVTKCTKKRTKWENPVIPPKKVREKPEAPGEMHCYIKEHLANLPRTEKPCGQPPLIFDNNAPQAWSAT